MGGSITSISTKIAIAMGVLSGMKAAYFAFKAGATASKATRVRSSVAHRSKSFLGNL